MLRSGDLASPEESERILGELETDLEETALPADGEPYSDRAERAAEIRKRFAEKGLAPRQCPPLLYHCPSLDCSLQFYPGMAVLQGGPSLPSLYPLLPLVCAQRLCASALRERLR